MGPIKSSQSPVPGILFAVLIMALAGSALAPGSAPPPVVHVGAAQTLLPFPSVPGAIPVDRGSFRAGPTAPCVGLPADLSGVFSTNYTGACLIDHDLTISPGASLVVWGPHGNLTIGNLSTPLVLNISGTLHIDLGSGLGLLRGSHLTIFVWGTLLVAGQSLMTLSPTSTLMLEPGGHLDILGGSTLLMNGSSLYNAGGAVELVSASWVSGDTVPVTPLVDRLNITGPLNAWNSTGTDLRYVNFTSTVQRVTITGFYSRPATVDRVNLASVRDISLDEALVGNVSLTSVDNLTIGHLGLSPDLVEVQNLTVAAAVPCQIAIAHALLQGIHLSGAANVTLANSTVGAGASGLLEASRFLRANDSTQFEFPLDLSTGALVELTNVTTPALSVTGPAQVIVENWPSASAFINGAYEVPNISVENPRADVQVYRYALFHVTAPASSQVPTGTVLAIHDAVAGGPAPETFSLPLSGNLGIFLLTDNITAAGDTFLGQYVVSATAPGLSQTTTVTLVSDNEVYTLALAPGPLVISYSPYVLVALGALVAVATATVLLWHRTRQLRRWVDPLPEEGADAPAEDEEDS